MCVCVVCVCCVCVLCVCVVCVCCVCVLCMYVLYMCVVHVYVCFVYVCVVCVCVVCMVCVLLYVVENVCSKTNIEKPLNFVSLVQSTHVLSETHKSTWQHEPCIDNNKHCYLLRAL